MVWFPSWRAITMCIVLFQLLLQRSRSHIHCLSFRPFDRHCVWRTEELALRVFCHAAHHQGCSEQHCTYSTLEYITAWIVSPLFRFHQCMVSPNAVLRTCTAHRNRIRAATFGMYIPCGPNATIDARNTGVALSTLSILTLVQPARWIVIAFCALQAWDNAAIVRLHRVPS